MHTYMHSLVDKLKWFYC